MFIHCFQIVDWFIHLFIWFDLNFIILCLAMCRLKLHKGSYRKRKKKNTEGWTLRVYLNFSNQPDLTKPVLKFQLDVSRIIIKNNI